MINLNNLQGILAFIFMGIFSDPFWTTITGRMASRVSLFGNLKLGIIFSYLRIYI